MDDLFLLETQSEPPFNLSLHQIRILKIIARGQGQFVKLPLKFKFDHKLVDEMVTAGILKRGESGWPGVPAYKVTPKGSDAQRAWLSSQATSAAHSIPKPARPFRAE